MGIERIRLSNFKSFGNVDVALGDFTVVVGANASGKTNFVQAFRFLRDIARHGLENALSLQGESAYTLNASIGTRQELLLSAYVCDQSEGLMIGTQASKVTAHINRINYDFSLQFTPDGQGYSIPHEEVTLHCRFSQQATENEPAKQGSGTITTRRVNKQVTLTVDAPDISISDQPLLELLVQANGLGISSTELLLETPFFPVSPYVLAPSNASDNLFADIAIYDFDPKLPKRATPVTGKRTLEEDGSNLAIVLKHIIDDPDKKKLMTQLMRDMLPFVTDIGVERIADKSLLFNLREMFSENLQLPASLMSDGTINLTAIIVALYFEERPVVIIEEPERNIHPKLIANIVEMLREVSRRKQVIVTTQSPEVVKAAGVGPLLLVSRDASGFSVISRPAEAAITRTFLENEIGVDELFVQNLLGVEG